MADSFIHIIASTFAVLSARLSFRFIPGRKVRTAKGNTPVNGRSCSGNYWDRKTVPQKITTFPYSPEFGKEKVKM